MGNLSEVNPIAKDLVQSASGVCCTTRLPTGTAGPNFAHCSSFVEVRLQFPDAAQFEIQAEDLKHPLGLFFMNDQPAILKVVAPRDCPTHPHPSPFGGSNFIPNPFASNFALELSKGKQDIQGQPAY